ncbi:uncharacterized protein UMAG_05987 [Mycosarcoma maydis]|uniref:Fungal lipase-like domain-containing protein n=1 Tax=Mycosarcoma maydis TaxID=5270 RepID=A0A0D1CFT8_MYCMD|nr:uncharacterized protein UMAG_05987 [Ustilago maydis 521]KIS65898.1 hypothetical protein UMAG_05987 [Ustilago maydis 521]|eukprot:XP_011392370.1 hypothetical protein UMAG_05987 [Ustilago maydis 521]
MRTFLTAQARAGALALFALAAVAQQVAASNPRLNRIDLDLWQRNLSIEDALPFFARDLPRLSKRQGGGIDSPSNDTQNAIVAQSATDPIAAAQAVEQIPNVAANAAGNTDTTGNILKDDGYYNFPWNNATVFNPSAETSGSDEGGWQALPETAGFTLNRTFSVYNVFGNESGIMPFYISNNPDPTKVLRAIVVWPGKPRDVWKYANLMLNARSVAVSNKFAQQGATNDSFLIVAPAMLNQMDLQAGAARPNEIVFHGSGWQRGAGCRNPVMRHRVTSYAAVDQIVDLLFDTKTYPNLNQVVIAGHSMGGQASQRYALLKKTKAYDDNMRFWIGNPGSWAWLTDSRPYMNINGSCSPNEAWDTWPYGLNGNQTKITPYARRDVIANKTYVINRFLNRHVSYALALLDIGAGDTHCEARWQGGNHLDRGSEFVLQYANTSTLLQGKFPPKHTLDYIANVSHQDYAMYSTNMSIQRLFYDDLMVRYKNLTNTTNPGDRKKKAKGTKAFATPAHEKVAIGLLAGSLGLVFLVFTALPIIFTADHVKDIDTSWDAQSYLSSESRRMLVDRKW